MRWLGRALVFILLTLLTQVGGLAYIAALAVGRMRVPVFIATYSALWVIAVTAAPTLGREPLPCFGEPLRMQSPFYCVTLRHFVTPDTAQVARQAAETVAQSYPETVTLALDGNFPFFDGFPLIPHLSHDDGEKLDFALYYRDGTAGYVGPRTRSPIGYFAFETLGAGTCPNEAMTLRWNFVWVQRWWRDWTLDQDRNAALIRALASDPRVSKIFVEPPLADQLGVSGPKIRFQGCRAARHDDHIHVQL